MPLLEVVDLEAHYGHAHVLQGVTLNVDAGEVVSLFGRNGAGKTTTLKTIMGWLAPSAGTIAFDGRAIGGLSPDRICRMGIGYIPEDRRIFPTLSVEENLRLGFYQSPGASKAKRSEALDAVYAHFPRLGERRRQLGRTLSGGEQQMLAIGRALIGDPRLILVDEPSEGLAPMIVKEIFETIFSLQERGIAMLLVEQNVMRTAPHCDRSYVIEKGRIISSGTPQALLADLEIRKKLSV